MHKSGAGTQAGVGPVVVGRARRPASYPQGSRSNSGSASGLRSDQGS